MPGGFFIFGVFVNRGGKGEGVEEPTTPESSNSAGSSDAVSDAEQRVSLAAKIREASSGNEAAAALLGQYESLVEAQLSKLEEDLKQLRPSPETWEYRRKAPQSLTAYPKRLLTFREQAELLLSRGMIGDVDVMEHKLSSTNYYRLSGYFYFFREHQGATRNLGERYREGTTFGEVWEIYEFDSRLRELVNAAIEKIEVAVRTQVSYHHAREFDDVFAYVLRSDALEFASKEHEGGTTVDGRQVYLLDLQRLLTRSKEQFIDHFYNTYSDRYPPIFITSEVLTLGAVKAIYDGSPLEVRREVANHFRLPPRTLGSWLLTLNTARNVCAHHSRFWNRSLGNRPGVPPRTTHPEFHKPFPIVAQPHKVEGRTVQPPSTFAILSLCNYLLTVIDERSGWASALQKLLEEFPRVKRVAMGFPEDWMRSPIWRNLAATEPTPSDGETPTPGDAPAAGFAARTDTMPAIKTSIDD